MEAPRNLLGTSHYELREEYGYHDTLIGRYETRERAEEEKQTRLQLAKRGRIGHGTYRIVYREL